MGLGESKDEGIRKPDEDDEIAVQLEYSKKYNEERERLIREISDILDNHYQKIADKCKDKIERLKEKYPDEDVNRDVADEIVSWEEFPRKLHRKIF